MPIEMPLSAKRSSTRKAERDGFAKIAVSGKTLAGFPEDDVVVSQHR
ncbi:MAG: hypothetical protein V4568_12320 [Pseudomonadota bacterium]